jgi:hypothetical protein
LGTYRIPQETGLLIPSGYRQNMQAVIDEMQLPNSDYALQVIPHNRALAMAGWIPGIVILAILLYCRGAFWKAAEAAKNNSC